MGISKRYINERNEKAPKKWTGPFMITEVHQEGSFYRRSTVTTQDIDRKSMKYIKTKRDDPSWAAQEGQLLITASNVD